ncbi:hypothetical protein SGLAM104S_01710 [Streptomyces glaucescens]
MADHLEASVTLPSDPASVSAARAYVVGTLAEWGLPPDTDVADTIRLIVSELATNAVQHTFGQSPTNTVDVRLDRDERLRIGVTDSHPRFPKRLPAAVQQDNGRGMVIIRCLTAECARPVASAPHPRGRQDRRHRTAVEDPGPAGHGGAAGALTATRAVPRNDGPGPHTRTRARARCGRSRAGPGAVTAGQVRRQRPAGVDLTRPYQTLFVQIFCRRTTSPVLGVPDLLALSGVDPHVVHARPRVGRTAVPGSAAGGGALADCWARTRRLATPSVPVRA